VWDKICAQPRSIEAQLKDALHLAYELEDDYLVTWVNAALGEEYNRTNRIGLGVMHSLIVMEMQRKLGEDNFPGLSYARHHLGHMLYHSRDYELAVPVLMQAIKGFSRPETGKIDSIDAYYKMGSWNTLGLAFQKLEKYDSAFWAFHQALQIAEDHTLDFWTGLIKGNIGNVHFNLGEYEEAEPLLQTDVEQSIATQQYDNAANSLQLLARIDAGRNQPLRALEKLRKASGYWQHAPNHPGRVNLFEAYKIVFHQLDQADSLYVYSEKYQNLHDSLERVAFDNKAEIVKLRLDNQVAAYEIYSLNKEKRRITLIRNFTIGTILLLAGLAYVDFKRQKLKIQLQQQAAQERQRLAELEVQNAREQLVEFTRRILEKSELVESLQEQLLQKELTAEQHQMIVELTHQQLLTDADWDKFKSLFERVYPGFFISVRDRAPDITLAELRMAALIKLQLTSREAASLLGVSLDTIHKTRQRLKQRLQLSPEADLDHLVLSL
jgi:tetratricopeptide (TPR) repeat protein